MRWEGGDDRWLADTLRFIAREAESMRPGIVAERFGYRSEAAVCRAFKREFGISPGKDRRLGPTQLLSA